jgi:hypothetical protein
MKSLPPPSRKCSDSFLACVPLTIPLRQGYMRREKPARSCKRIEENKKALNPNKTPSPPGSEERYANYLSKDMRTMKISSHSV